MRHDRAFYSAFAVSLAFHLSMVTLFSIVILFPRNPVQFYSLRFVRSSATFADAPRQTLRVPSFDEALHGDEDDFVPGRGLPWIDIPRLEFAELERLELRQQTLQTRDLYLSREQRAPQDSWEWFGRELHQLRNALARLPAALRDGERGPPKRQPVATPLEGFQAYIEWLDDPPGRQLLFSPPIEALWRLQGRSLDEPIVLLFTVNAQGRVIEVIDPIDDESGIVSSAGKALLRYRFDPIGTDADDQHGTLIIATETEGDR